MLIRFKKNDRTEYPQWEEKRLGEILFEYSNKNNQELHESVAVGRYGIRRRSDIYSKDLSKDISNNKLIFKDTLTIGMGSSQIDIGILLDDIVYSVSPAYSTFHIKNCDSKYLIYFFEAINKKLSKLYMITGARQGKAVDKQSFLQDKRLFPCLEEQQKIATFLSTVDQKIEKQKSVVADYEELKKGTMQKIFNQEVRFKDDDGNEFPEWEEKKFGNYIEEFSNKTRIENETTLLSSAINGMFLNSELFGHQRGSSNIGYKKVNKGTLILSTQNLHLGNANVNLRFEEGMVSPAYKTYKLIECDEKFMSYWIKREEAKTFFFNATTVGASMCRRNVEWDELYNSKINIPCITEQKKIADCLSALDKKIEAEKKILADLEELKKGLLQGIFNN